MKFTTSLLLLGMFFGSSVATESNLIYNSDFSANDCHSDRCTYTQQNYLGNCVQGWLPHKQIQLGHGSNYCDTLSNQVVVKLPAQTGSCVTQFVPNVKAGSYQFSLNYGAEKGSPFQQCQVEPFFNGKSLGKYRPSGHQEHNQQVNFDVDNDCQYAQIKVCGGNGAASAWIRVMQLIKKTRGSLTFQPTPMPTYDQIKSLVTPNPIVPVTQFIKPIVVLDSHSLQCYKRQFTLQAGWNQISFDYRDLFSGYVFNSNVAVKFNGQVIGVIYPKDCEQHEFVYNVNLPAAGKYLIEFCPAGCVGEVFHKVIIKDLCIVPKPCLAKQFQNLITNGNFEQTACTGSFCIWNNSNIPVNGVPGWIPSPQIQIGYGNVYNSQFGSSNRVLQLDPNANSCVRQQLALKPGKHTLKYDRAARQGVSLQSNQLSVSVNGQQIQAIHPTDYNIHQQTVNFDLTNPPVTSEVVFCAKGTSESYGALIDNVQLFYLDECKNVPLVGLPYPNVPTVPTLPTYPTMTGWPTKPTGW